MSMHVKRGDTVLVIAGKDKGKTGKIISCDPDNKCAKVDGVNVTTKHKKPRKAGDQGGLRKIAGNIDASNLMVVCPGCGKASRTGSSTTDAGKKIRVCVKCKASVEASVKADKKDKKKKAEKAVKDDKKAKKDDKE